MSSLNVNLLGGPGIDKSLAAARLLVGLRTLGHTAELVTSCATDLEYANQLYRDTQVDLAQVQHQCQALRQDKAEFVICQTPAVLTLAYADQDDHDAIRRIVREDLGGWACLNVLLHREVASDALALPGAADRASRHADRVVPLMREFFGPNLVELAVDTPDAGEILLAQALMYRRLYERTAVAEMFGA